MAKDPQLGETIIWRGKPQVVTTPPLFKALAMLWFLVSASATCFAIVTSWGLHTSPLALLIFALWTATLGLACMQGPKMWMERVEYIITEGHVIWRRGPLRRVISRSSINYARIFWHPDNPSVGDVELVRAVPVGALRRRLLLRLQGLAAPDRVWSLIRGADSHTEGSNSALRSVVATPRRWRTGFVVVEPGHRLAPIRTEWQAQLAHARAGRSVNCKHAPWRFA